MKKKLIIITLSAAICMPSYSFAFGLGDITSSIPDVPGLSGGGGDVADLEKGQVELADETRKVMVDFITSLEYFQDALGLERNSSLSSLKANCLEKKICPGDDSIERIEESSDEIKGKSQSLIDEGVKLSVGSSKKFKKGLIPYGKGLLGGASLGKKIAEVTPKYTSAIAANPLTAPSVLETGLNIAKQIPPILSTLSNASGGIYNFAMYNGIEKPEEAEAE